MILVSSMLLFAKVSSNPVGAGHAGLSVIESGVNDAVFVGIGLTFLARAEVALKRRRALQSLRQLRSLAHVIDLHQLSKDPSKFPAGHSGGAVNRQQTETYLQFCVELLAIVGVLAAMHAQELADVQVVAAASDIERLSVGLSEKMWNKVLASRLLPYDPREPQANSPKGSTRITRALEVTSDPKSPFMVLEVEYRYSRAVIQRAWNVARSTWPDPGGIELLRRLVDRVDKGEDPAAAWAELNG